MNDHKRVGCIVKNDGLGKPEEVRSLLGRLLVDARLYKEGQSYKELLDFVGRLPNFAPFNAMLLQVQKPGLMYAASAHDWREIFGRRLKDGARPLLILWPFGPVALVYDEVDTEGKELPEDVTSFRARYKSKDMDWKSFDLRLRRKGIFIHWIDAGDGKAGSIRKVGGKSADEPSYQVQLNRNHDCAVQFTTLAHELGHLCLGHIGPNKKLHIPWRVVKGRLQEIEAESVAYLVSIRNNVESNPEQYLSEFVQSSGAVPAIDVHQVMRAAGQVETLLGIEAHSRFDQPEKRLAGNERIG